MEKVLINLIGEEIMNLELLIPFPLPHKVIPNSYSPFSTDIDKGCAKSG